MDAEQIWEKYGYPDRHKPKGDNMNMNAGGVKFDADKIRMDLIPQDAIMAIAAVFTYGAIKYEDWNWAKGMRDGRLDAAYERHRAAYMLGDTTDDESGLPHLWHMGCCVLMRISAHLRGVLEDDRNIAPVSMAAIDVIYRNMKDPRGTDHWADDIADTPEEKAVLDEVADSKSKYDRYGAMFMGLTTEERKLLQCVIDGADWPFAGSRLNAMLDFLKDNSLIEVSNGVYTSTDVGRAIMNAYKEYIDRSKVISSGDRTSLEAE